MEDMNNKKIYLCSISPEAEKGIEDEKYIFGPGGPRRQNGTIKELAKPLQCSLDDLKKMFGNEKQLELTNKKIEILSAEMDISKEGIEELTRVGWLNYAMTAQLCTITHEGFMQVISGIDNLSFQVEQLGIHIRQTENAELKEKTVRFIAFLEDYDQKLGIERFDLLNSNAARDINEIYAFIDRLYDELNNASDNGFLLFQIICQLIHPFTTVACKFGIRYYYDNNQPAINCAKWFELIEKIANDSRFINKFQYYINLKMDIPYKDKISIGKKCREKFLSLPETISFLEGYALTHSKEEYLSLEKKLRGFVDAPETIPEDGRIYL